MRRLLLLLSLLLLTVGCASAAASEPTAPATPSLPTLIPSPTPEYNNIGDAYQVVVNYLDAWQRQDLVTMYTSISVESQQSTPFDSFQVIYNDAHEVIRLLDLTYTMRTSFRETNRVVVFTYDVTFNSNVIGEFTDAEREIRLVLDDDQQAWRIAWTPGDIFTELASGAILRMETFAPRRANIYDRNGEILADMNGQIATVSVIRGQINDLNVCVATLAEALNQPVESLLVRVSNFGTEQLGEVGILEPTRFTEWQTRLEADCDARFDNRPVRRYINGQIAPHIVGYVGYPTEEQIPDVEWAGFQQDSIIGRSGVEASWNSTLAGQPGGRLTIITPNGDRLRLLAERGASPGESVYLTIDVNLQRFAMETLRRRYSQERFPQSQGASVIVLDVNTGEILAMVSYPTFDANAFNSFPVMGTAQAQQIVQAVQNDPARPQLNRPTQGGYPTGSVMKVMTAIAALNSGLYSYDERYTSVGVWNRDIPRTDWQPGGHGSQTNARALVVSCNTCFYEAGWRMDQSDPYLLPGYANRLGLGVRTGLTDIVESPGSIAGPDTKSLYALPGERPWSFSDAVNLAIGQGFVEVTPLQMVRLYSTVVNGGMLYRPQLVHHTGLLDQTGYVMTPEVISDTEVDSEVFNYIKSALCRVTTESYGTAEFIFGNSPLQTIGVCGKTGTAQSPGALPPHAWFVGMAPRDNPQIAVIAMVENSGEGSEVAAPIVCEVLEFFFFGAEIEPQCPRYG